MKLKLENDKTEVILKIKEVTDNLNAKIDKLIADVKEKCIQINTLEENVKAFSDVPCSHNLITSNISTTNTTNSNVIELANTVATSVSLTASSLTSNNAPAVYSQPEQRTAYLDYRYVPECCNHRHVPGRGGHNVPPDGSQCCYHRCRNNPHFLSQKPRP